MKGKREEGWRRKERGEGGREEGLMLRLSALLPNPFPPSIFIRTYLPVELINHNKSVVYSVCSTILSALW
jgi:hypothetical protein